ncbi:class I SAM-dependent methyltransferase [Caldicellulosiruptoraceae bacterium PP1]
MSKNIEKAKRLDSDERKKILNPDQILPLFNISRGKILADIGCGTGYFSIPIAKMIGEEGKVFAIDVDNDMLLVLSEKVAKEGINNIEFILSKEYNFIIEDDIADYALIANVLHEIEDKRRFLDEAKRILKSNGVLFIIEWQKKETTFGPRFEERIDIDECINLLKTCGFSDCNFYVINDYFYLVKCFK